MPDSIMFQNDDAYVVLETNQPEVILTEAELFEKLRSVLAAQGDDLPRELRKYSTLDEQARHLLETACDFDLGPGQFLQWYVVRLEKA